MLTSDRRSASKHQSLVKKIVRGGRKLIKNWTRRLVSSNFQMFVLGRREKYTRPLMGDAIARHFFRESAHFKSHSFIEDFDILSKVGSQLWKLRWNLKSIHVKIISYHFADYDLFSYLNPTSRNQRFCCLHLFPE